MKFGIVVFTILFVLGSAASALMSALILHLPAFNKGTTSFEVQWAILLALVIFPPSLLAFRRKKQGE